RRSSDLDVWKPLDAPATTAGTFAPAKNESGPTSAAFGLTEPQPPPPLMPIYQPVQVGAGGAFSGISAAYALPAKRNSVAAKSALVMTRPLIIDRSYFSRVGSRFM